MKKVLIHICPRGQEKLNREPMLKKIGYDFSQPVSPKYYHSYIPKKY